MILMFKVSEKTAILPRSDNEQAKKSSLYFHKESERSNRTMRSQCLLQN